MERGNPVFSPDFDQAGETEAIVVRHADGNAGIRGGKKRMPPCNRVDTGSNFARLERELTSHGCSVARESAESLKEGKQMTATLRSADAPTNRKTSWKSINWKTIRKSVKRLQVRIAKAVKEVN